MIDREVLKEANIHKEWWELCSIENGMIHTPSKERLYENKLITEKEYQEYLSNKIDTCLEEIKSNELLTKENEQLWETVEFLLKQVELIPKEVI